MFNQLRRKRLKQSQSSERTASKWSSPSDDSILPHVFASNKKSVCPTNPVPLFTEASCLLANVSCETPLPCITNAKYSSRYRGYAETLNESGAVRLQYVFNVPTTEELVYARGKPRHVLRKVKSKVLVPAI